MAGLSVLLLVAVGLVAWRLIGSAEEPYHARPPAPVDAAIDQTAAVDTLRSLERAWQRGDREAASALAPTGSWVSAQLAAAATNIAGARVRGLSLRYVDATGGLDADGTWPAVVEVRWKYAGFDRRAARAEVAFSFRAGAEGVVVASAGGGGEITPLWLSGPLAIRRSSHTLVLAPGEEQAREYEKLAQRAVPQVQQVLGSDRGNLVIEAPAGQKALEETLGADAGYYAQIAAVTTSPDTENTPGASWHVFLNPEVFDQLDRDGQDVVLAHELVHVETDAPQSSAPTWLVEGFADYVALYDTTLPLSKTAAQIRDLVADDGLPAGLPGSSDFNTGGPHLGAIYEGAWLLCQTLADQGGEEALVSFYDAVSDDTTLADGLKRWFGWSEDDLVSAWQDRLSHLPS